MTATPSSSAPVWRRLVPPALALALVAALGAALLRPRSDGNAGGPLLNRPAPAFTLAALDGGTFSSAQLKGQPLVLNFWASWCVPCEREAPLLRELNEKQGGRLRVVGIVSQDKNQTKIRNFVAKYGLAYPNLLDNTLKTTIDYGILGVPETFFIGADGLIKSVDRGELTRERLRSSLKAIGVDF